MKNYEKLESQGDERIVEAVYINGEPVTLTEEPETGDGEEENATDD